MKVSDAAHHIVEALAGGNPVVEVVVVQSDIPRAPVGARLLVWDGSTTGSLGADELDARVIQTARQVLRSRRPVQATVEAPGGEVAVYVEPHYPPDELIIVGAGHIARPLCRIGAMLGFGVTVLDDRAGFATRERFPEAERLVKADFSDLFQGVRLGPGSHLVLVTRGHKYDYEALRELLTSGPELAYIGMVGSQRRVRAALDQLAREGIPPDRLAQVYAPIGLDIEAETPEEIAISIGAELVRVRRGGTGASMRDRARVVERWIV